ncbi:iron ABC transporter permease [Desemzia sp. RIT804]|uniref:FecCD family ABC transporter permease n=1 Tax=Desemzia sp. RIT 804 TaxID=2810209 RepID=UPI00194F8FC3|nr:iron ABC transporter permease [Desemzia sp. RIT 804]MBM6614357.1 iron ABC transporter permease [Desemzia sp. RIT 804]
MKQNKTTFFISSCFVLLIVGVYLSISLGITKISILELIDSLWNQTNELDQILIKDVRIPRVLSALFTGGILGATGAMIQGITRNPIAEPSLLGVSQGATLVIALFYAANITINTQNVMVASLIGTSFSAALVMFFLYKEVKGKSVSKLLLAGISMSTFFISLTTTIGILSNKSQLIAFWISGSFRNVTWTEFKLVAIVGTLGLLLSLLLAKKINILSLGDEAAVGLGVDPRRTRLWTFLLLIPMCAAAVAVGKNIGFVGVIIPQINRRLVGENYAKNIPLSFLLGAVLMVYSDMGARLVYAPYEMPVGIITALIGVPFFIAAARKESA